MSANDSTINLDDSSVLDSTVNSSVIDLVSTSEDDNNDYLSSKAVEIISSDEEDHTEEITSVKSPFLASLEGGLSSHKMKLTEEVVTGYGDRDVENVGEIIEKTFRDKTLATSFGDFDDNETIDIVDDEDISPHKRKVDGDKAGLPAKRQKPVDLPDTVQVLVCGSTGTKVYLVGTAHFSKESCEDVAMVIQATQPDIVMVELCKSRTNILHLDEQTILEEAQNLNMEKSLEIIRSQGTVQGVMYLLLLSMSAHLTKELGMAPGGEFRRAFQEANTVPGCMVHLGDRPINITLKRALSALSLWQRLRLTWNILTSKETITKEEVEKCKNRDLLENMLLEMAGEFPALSRVFVEERDLFLAHSLQTAAQIENTQTVVGVVGIGHVPGIVNNWDKVTREQVEQVVRIEPPSVVSRVIKFSVKSVFWGGCLYGAFKLVSKGRLLLVR